MSGDFSRQTLEREKQYSAVYMQQGRVQTDYDWNAAAAIDRHRSTTEETDVIGVAGVPKGLPDSFKLSVQSGKVVVGAGHCYVHGLLVQNPAESRPDSPTYDLHVSPQPTDGPGLYLAYVCVWERPITQVEDPTIREVALGGVDTTTRLEHAWQVRFFRLGNQDPNASCIATDTTAWGNAMQPGTGTMRVSYKADNTGSGHSVLPPSADYRGLENQLYRIEIHRSGSLDGGGIVPTFKWSRENASVVTPILNISGTVLKVGNVGRDDVLGFANGQWAEVRDDRREFAREEPGYLVKLSTVTSATREIILTANLPGSVDTARGHAKLIRWDHRDPPGDTNGIALSTTPTEIENGIQVEFSNGTYKTGDYWLIPARTAVNSETGEIEWPRNTADEFIFVAPHVLFGIKRYYAKLALLNFDGTNFQTLSKGDCRNFFPPLTGMTASDVSFDNTVCTLPEATNVQQALDQLCQRNGSSCTVLVGPGDNLVAAFAQIADGQDAQICFRVGTYTLPQPLQLRNKGHLRLSGCGPGTHIVAPTAEAALLFAGCKSVSVDACLVESGRVGTGTVDTSDLNGTLTFLNCPTIELENVDLRCAGGAGRAASCLTVRNGLPQANTPPSSVRVRHCDLEIGHQQVGILLVNVARAQVEDNTVRAGAKPDFSILLQDPGYRARLRRQMISGVQAGVAGVAPPSGTNATVTFAAHIVHFRSDPTLVRGNHNDNEWQRAITAINPRDILSARALQAFLERFADQVLIHHGTLPGASGFFRTVFSAIITQDTPAVAQGIVVSGELATDVRILNNTLQSVIQGIHIGLSRRELALGAPIMAETVQIHGNTINVTLPTSATRERHGIFVGNCASMLVENNYLTVQRASRNATLRLEGIRIFGHVDRRVIVRSNHLTAGFSVGITFAPLNDAAFHSPLWIITENVAVQARVVVHIPARSPGSPGVPNPDQVRQKVRGLRMPLSSPLDANLA